MMNERIEQLINRRLDGALTEQESLELDKALIRDPEARAMLETYQEMDELAGEALAEVIPSEERIHDALVLDTSSPRRLPLVLKVGLSFAAAAVLALWVSGLPTAEKGDAEKSTPIVVETIANPNVLENVAYKPAPISATPVMYGPRREQQRISRDVIGVYDEESQRMYLLEMERQDTHVVPVSWNY